MKKVTRRGVGLILTLLAAILVTSCVASRSITTTQTHMKNGDTIATMTTKQVESYTAKPLQNPLN